MSPMIPIYIVIGTRGQFTKTAPVMQELTKRCVPYMLINTGQHTASSQEIARIFGIGSGDAFITRRTKDIVSITSALCWLVQALSILLFRRKKIFPQGKGLVLIHGDTLSTVLGLLGARLCGMKVAHIESGLRSHSYWHPFPEEIIRIICCRFSHALFAPSDAACQNLVKCSARTFNTQGNTVFDAIEGVAALSARKPFAFPYCVVTIHRSEVLFRDNLFKTALSAVYRAATFIKVIFIVHKATMERLRACGELARIENDPNIIIDDYYDYPSFMSLVKNAQFVMTDGGGLQEETYYLNVPCLILRKRTERNDGLHATALLSEFNEEKIDYFLKHFREFRRGPLEHHHASRFIAEKIIELTCENSN